MGGKKEEDGQWDEFAIHSILFHDNMEKIWHLSQRQNSVNSETIPQLLCGKCCNLYLAQADGRERRQLLQPQQLTTPDMPQLQNRF